MGINYTKHKVKRPKFEEEEQLELDHSAWEQVPQASEGELLCRAAEAGLLPLVQLLLTRRASPEGHLAGHHRRHGLTPLHFGRLWQSLLLRRTASDKQCESHDTRQPWFAATAQGS